MHSCADFFLSDEAGNMDTYAAASESSKARSGRSPAERRRRSREVDLVIPPRPRLRAHTVILPAFICPFLSDLSLEASTLATWAQLGENC